jgi:hypothetical protein
VLTGTDTGHVVHGPALQRDCWFNRGVSTVPIWEIREERLYYVDASTKDRAEELYGDAHATDAAGVEVVDIRQVRDGRHIGADNIISDEEE